MGHYNVSQIDNPMSAGRFLWGAKELVETLVEQVPNTRFFVLEQTVL